MLFVLFVFASLVGSDIFFCRVFSLPSSCPSQFAVLAILVRNFTGRADLHHSGGSTCITVGHCVALIDLCSFPCFRPTIHLPLHTWKEEHDRSNIEASLFDDFATEPLSLSKGCVSLGIFSPVPW